jgi:hypothetical protein
MNQLDLAQGGCNGGARASWNEHKDLSISCLVEYKAEEKKKRERVKEEKY